VSRWNKGVALSDSKGGVVGQRPEWVDEQRRRVDDLIDEYRVALFAQPMRTAVPVSAKRIRAAVAELKP